MIHHRPLETAEPDRHILARLTRPDLLLIHDSLTETASGETRSEAAYGCDQDWYGEPWQRQAGCGPCTSATILYYLARTDEKLAGLYPAPSLARPHFIAFMDRIWHYVTPGRMGVNEASMLINGVRRFASEHQINLSASLFCIPGPGQSEARTPVSDFAAFIQTGLSMDMPVAFLNLSNGRLDNLDSWHWVTLTCLAVSDDGRYWGEISDSGTRKWIDLSLWYQTSLLGGAAVYFNPEQDGSAANLVDHLDDR